VVDEGARVPSRDAFDAWQGASEDLPGVLHSHIAACENEGADAGGLQGEEFEAAVTDALVARENDPAIGTGPFKPDSVLGALGEVVG